MILPIWPWSELQRLRDVLAYEREWKQDYQKRALLMENMALNAIRDKCASHKGIRRLVEKNKRLKKQLEQQAKGAA